MRGRKDPLLLRKKEDSVTCPTTGEGVERVKEKKRMR